MRMLLLTASALAIGCASVAPIHERAAVEGRGPIMCMAADGQWIGEETIVDPTTGEGTSRCPAPARYVLLPPCGPDENRPEETAALFEARRQAAQDGSLYGDRFENQPLCAPSLTGPPKPPPLPPPQPPGSGRREPRPPGIVYDRDEVRAYVEEHVGRRFGEDALTRAAAAPSSVLVVIQPSMPRPVQRPDGSWGYEGPWVNAVSSDGRRWLGWKTGAPLQIGSEVAAEIDGILADPAFWREAEYAPAEGCLDGSAYSVVVRHAGKMKVGRQICMPRGLTGRLASVALNEAQSLR